MSKLKQNTPTLNVSSVLNCAVALRYKTASFGNNVNNIKSKGGFTLINKVEIAGVNTAKLPVLSNEEKQELLIRIKNGDNEARERFINGNLRLVLSVVQRFARKRREYG